MKDQAFRLGASEQDREPYSEKYREDGVELPLDQNQFKEVECSVRRIGVHALLCGLRQVKVEGVKDHVRGDYSEKRKASQNIEELESFLYRCRGQCHGSRNSGFHKGVYLLGSVA